MKPRQLDSLYNQKEIHNKEIWKQIKHNELLLSFDLQLGTAQEKLDRCLTIRGLLNQIWE